MTTRVILSWSLVSLALTGSVARAQSLAELARQEEARRKAVTVPARAFTNQDVPTNAPAEPAPAVPPSGSPGVTGRCLIRRPAPRRPKPCHPQAPMLPQRPMLGRHNPPRPAGSGAGGRAAIVGDQGRNLLAHSVVRGTREARANRGNAPGVRAAVRGPRRPLCGPERSQPSARRSLPTWRRRNSRSAACSRRYTVQAQQVSAIEEQARRAGVPPGWVRLPEA